MISREKTVHVKLKIDLGAKKTPKYLKIIARYVILKIREPIASKND